MSDSEYTVYFWLVSILKVLLVAIFLLVFPISLAAYRYMGSPVHFTVSVDCTLKILSCCWNQEGTA